MKGISVKLRLLVVLLLAAALPCGLKAQAQWNGFFPNENHQIPLTLRVADGDLSSVLGTFTFLAQTLKLPPNTTSYVYLDLLAVGGPQLIQNTTGFPTTGNIYTIAIATTDSQFIVALTDARPKWNPFLGGGGSGGGFPRLDQVLNQNTSKTFDQGGSLLAFQNGPFNLTNDTSFVIPNVAGCNPGDLGSFCFDTTFNNYVGNNGVRSLFGVFDPTGVSDSDIAGFRIVAGHYTLVDLGATSGSTFNQFITAQITNIQNNDALCFDTTIQNFINCTPGIPVNLQTGTSYAVDGLNDRGVALIARNNSAKSYTLGQIVEPGNFGANWFNFNFSQGTGDTTYTTTTSVFDNTGTQSFTLHQGQQCTFITDPSGSGTIYPKCHEPLLTAGSGISFTRTNYGLQIAATGSGGTVTGTGTTNQVVKFTNGAAGVIGDSTCQDDGTNPTRCPNGLNTALNGNFDEWVVDTGGVTANKLVCRSSSSKVQICATNTTQGVIGVALTTQTSGQTVKVCWAAKCNVVSSNATTAGHWLIPSTSVAGDVDDTGSTTQPNATQTFLAESSVSGGSTVLVTLLAPDTIGAAQGKPHSNHGISFTIGDPAGAALTAVSTTTDYVTVPFSCKIQSYWINIDGGTITVKFWKVASGTAIPTSGNSISTSGVSISSGTAIQSNTLSDFTTTQINANDILAMNVSTVATAKYVNGGLSCQE